MWSLDFKSGSWTECSVVIVDSNGGSTWADVWGVTVVGG